MNKLLNITLKELKMFFYTPIAYIIAFSFYTINGILFWYLVNQANTPGELLDGNILSQIIGGAVAWFTILILIPVISMRLVAFEQEKKRLAHLFTTPVSNWQITLGKFFGGLSFYLILWFPTIIYAYILSLYSEIDKGTLIAGYFGLFLVGSFTLSIGLFCSTLSKNQIVSAILTFTILLSVLMISWFETLIDNGSVFKEALQHLNFINHFTSFSEGIINTKDIIFFLTGTWFFLTASNEMIKLKRSQCD